MIALLVAPAMGFAAPGDAGAKPAPGVTAAQLTAPVRMTPDLAAKIPDGKKVDVAAQGLKDIKKNVERVTDRSEQARKEKDVGKLNCLNVQLTQMRALARVAQLADEALVDAVGKADSATANTQFARIVIAVEKVQRMGTEADICLGQLAFLMDGRTNVNVDQPPDLPSRDVTLRKPVDAPFEAPPIVRPKGASQYY
jgi:hypothetical protein